MEVPIRQIEHLFVVPTKLKGMSATPSLSLVEDQPAWMHNLNAEQRQAVTHAGGPLLILAGAGTGKTRTLVARLAHLVSTGTPPERILLVTFSRRAADEMSRRVGQFTDSSIARRINAGTFHAVANRLLRVYGTSFGLPSGFTVIDSSDAADLMNLIRTDNGHGKQRRFPRKDTLVSIYSRTVNTQQPLEEVLNKWFPWCAADVDGVREIFKAYTERKRAQDLLDYDDLLLFWRAAALDPNTGPVLADLYDHILVDEYQDTNVVQADILRGLASRHAQLTVVGDDAQSIYSFRAATVRNILDFPAQFASTTSVALEENYRSNQPILELANAIINDATEGHRKSLWSRNVQGPKPTLATCPDERAQVDAVCDTVLAHLEDGVSLREQAVLFRAAHHSDTLEVELRKRNIPFVKFGGLKFLEATHVKDLLALLRILDNPYDELAWFRVLQLIDGVGAARAQKMITELGVRPRSDVGPIAQLANLDSSPKQARPAIAALAETFLQCQTGKLNPGGQIDRLRETLDPLLRQRYDNAEVRLRDLEQLSKLASEYTSTSRLVAELTLDPPTSTGDFAGDPLLDDDYLTLSTVHSAKGCEWKAVHVIHAADGMFPSDLSTGDAESIDEERRLFYVALTRAQERLHLYAPLRYHYSGAGAFGDAHSFAQRTRFLPSSIDPLLEHRAVRSATADSLTATGEMPVLTTSVDDMLKALW